MAQITYKIIEKGGLLLRFSISKNRLLGMNVFNINLNNYSEVITLPSRTTETVELKIPYDKLVEIANMENGSRLIEGEICVEDASYGTENCVMFRVSLDSTDDPTILNLNNTTGWIALNYEI